jgi:hypothetical protein
MVKVSDTPCLTWVDTCQPPWLVRPQTSASMVFMNKWQIIGEAIKSTRQTLHLALLLLIISAPPAIVAVVLARR